jgi:hypothetical protein
MATGSWYRGTPAALVEISPVAVPGSGLAAGDISNAAGKALGAPVVGVPGTGPLPIYLDMWLTDLDLL